jgi:hypothetical protein
MHTVCLTSVFIRKAAALGSSEEEIDALVAHIADDPTTGDEMRGTGGCRKLRWEGRGKGKSGGYRTITFYTGENLPVFLLTIYSKGTKASLTAAERSDLAALTVEIRAAYAGKIKKLRKDEGKPK